MASHGWKLIPLYRFDLATGRWCSRTFCGIADIAARAAAALRSIAPPDLGRGRDAGPPEAAATARSAHVSPQALRAAWDRVLKDASDIYTAAPALAVLASLLDVSGGDRATLSDCTPEIAAAVRGAVARTAAPREAPPTRGMWEAVDATDQWWVDGAQALARLRAEALVGCAVVDSATVTRVIQAMTLDCVVFENSAEQQRVDVPV